MIGHKLLGYLIHLTDQDIVEVSAESQITLEVLQEFNYQLNATWLSLKQIDSEEGLQIQVI